jgi:hypothetical protein
VSVGPAGGADGVGLSRPKPRGVNPGVTVAEVAGDGVGLCRPPGEGVNPGVTVAEVAGVGVAVTVGVVDGVGVTVADGEGVAVGLRVAVGVALGLGGVAEGVPGAGVLLAVGVGWAQLAPPATTPVVTELRMNRACTERTPPGSLATIAPVGEAVNSPLALGPASVPWKVPLGPPGETEYSPSKFCIAALIRVKK